MILGEQQLEAIDKIKSFILNSNHTAFSLIGSAGTGKTTIMLEIVEFLENRDVDFVLCAPTHQAKLVLESSTHQNVTTLHKLLSLSPNVEIDELDLLDLEFITKDSEIGIPNLGIVICDESSMINDSLFDKLFELSAERKSKILFLGDIKQLNPVKSNNTSKVFNVEDRFELTQIYRQKQDSALTSVLSELRDSSMIKFIGDEKPNGSIFTYRDPKDFLRESILNYKNTNSIMDCKVLSYTNERVKQFNKIIKKSIFKSGMEFNKFELLKGTDNFLLYNKFQFYNCVDYIITDISLLTSLGIPSFKRLLGYYIELYDTVYNVNYTVPILSPENCYDDDLSLLAAYIEDFRVKAIAEKKNKKKAGYLWKQYYSVSGSFATMNHLKYHGRVIKKQTFDSGYAQTIHKSQGSTYKNVYFDNQSITKYNLDESTKRQLQYVGISRTSNNVHILQ